MRQRHDTSTKPYYRCLSCPQFRSMCCGLPTRDMDLKGWCEYIRDVMDAYHLTIAYVAKEAEVSEKTIERIRAVVTDNDFMRATARRIEMVVLGKVTLRHVCDLEFDISAINEKVARLEAENENLRKDIARKARVIDRLLDSQ